MRRSLWCSSKQRPKYCYAKSKVGTALKSQISSKFQICAGKFHSVLVSLPRNDRQAVVSWPGRSGRAESFDLYFRSLNHGVSYKWAAGVWKSILWQIGSRRSDLEVERLCSAFLRLERPFLSESFSEAPEEILSQRSEPPTRRDMSELFNILLDMNFLLWAVFEVLSFKSLQRYSSSKLDITDFILYLHVPTVTTHSDRVN